MKPNHYTAGGIETIDFIRAKLTPEQFIGFCLGNVLKYVSRYGHKGAPIEDLTKALDYLQWAVAAQSPKRPMPREDPVLLRPIDRVGGGVGGPAHPLGVSSYVPPAGR